MWCTTFSRIPRLTRFPNLPACSWNGTIGLGVGFRQVNPDAWPTITSSAVHLREPTQYTRHFQRSLDGARGVHLRLVRQVGKRMWPDQGTQCHYQHSYSTFNSHKRRQKCVWVVGSPPALILGSLGWNFTKRSSSAIAILPLTVGSAIIRTSHWL